MGIDKPKYTLRPVKEANYEWEAKLIWKNSPVDGTTALGIGKEQALEHLYYILDRKGADFACEIDCALSYLHSWDEEAYEVWE